VTYNFQTGNNKIKQLTEFEAVTQNVVFTNANLPKTFVKRRSW